MKNCILIAAYNESNAIGPLVQSIRKRQFDIFVVDDGSTDHSGDIARREGAFVITLDQRHGKGFALQEGFHHILEQDYDGVITMDGDGQHDINDIGLFVEKAHEHQMAIITGNRMGNSQGMPVVRYLTNRFMSFLISFVCHQHIPDTQCGFRYIPCFILKKLSLHCRDFEIETEILMKASKQGVRIYSIPVRTIYDNEKSHIRPLKDTIRFFHYFAREICSHKKD